MAGGSRRSPAMGAGVGRAVYGRDGGTGPRVLAAALPGPGVHDGSAPR
jgi:hypothetical protein